ncbi:MAG: histidine phosphatase family protein [Rhodospirillales bacterium]|nr:histidine phosphatase family protein [Rhodospirillales bacterium]
MPWLRCRRLTMVRHGDTPHSRQGLTAGRRDPVLTPAGRHQAWRAARRLRDMSAGPALSSPLRRCRETAMAWMALSRRRVRYVRGLVERGWGELEDKPKSWRLPPLPASVEPEMALAARLRRVLALAGADPLLFAHSGVFRALQGLLGIARPVCLPTGGVAVLVRGRTGAWRVEGEIQAGPSRTGSCRDRPAWRRSARPHNLRLT